MMQAEKDVIHSDYSRRLNEMKKVYDDRLSEADRIQRLLTLRNVQLIDEIKKRDPNYTPESLDVKKSLLDYHEMASEIARLIKENDQLRLDIRTTIKPPFGYIITIDEEGQTIGILDPRGREVIVSFNDIVKACIYLP